MLKKKQQQKKKKKKKKKTKTDRNLDVFVEKVFKIRKYSLNGLILTWMKSVIK